MPLEEKVKLVKKLKKRPKNSEKCFLCEEQFEVLPRIVKKVLRILKKYEYETFLIGIKIYPMMSYVNKP